MVRIKSGAFQAFTGKIEEVDEARGTLKVMVRIFGRAEPIELRFIDVEKISFTEEE
jgi:transcriptional antiterminator NusG